MGRGSEKVFRVFHVNMFKVIFSLIRSCACVVLPEGFRILINSPLPKVFEKLKSVIVEIKKELLIYCVFIVLPKQPGLPWNGILNTCGVYVTLGPACVAMTYLMLYTRINGFSERIYVSSRWKENKTAHNNISGQRCRDRCKRKIETYMHCIQ